MLEEIIQIALTLIHKLSTSSLQVVLRKQSIDTGTINRALNCGQTAVAPFTVVNIHARTKKHAPGGRCETVPWPAARKLHSLDRLVFFQPGKLMDDVCLV